MSDNINIFLGEEDIKVKVKEENIRVEETAGKDGKSLRPMGAWSSGTVYRYLDLVNYQGSSYVALSAVPAGTLPTNTSYWMLNAEKGDIGGSVWGLIIGDLANQTDLKNALDAKADADQVYTKTADDALLSEKADIIHTSASGSLVHLTDGAPYPVDSLSVSIEPVQSGSGDPAPDNVRPISGHSTAVVTRTGKNLIDESTLEIGTLNTDGTPTNGSNRIRSGFIPIKEGLAYTVSVGNFDSSKGASIYTSVSYYEDNQITTKRTSYENWTLAPMTFNVPTGTKYIRALFKYNNDVNISLPDISNIQIELGSTASAYEPYQGTSLTIDLDGTRYGGTLDVLTGEMRVTHAYADENSFSSVNSSVNYSGLHWADYNPDNCSNDGTATCSMLQRKDGNSGWGSTVPCFSLGPENSNYKIRVYCTQTTISDFKTFFEDLQIVYPLATPFTVQLSPATLSLLLGENNLWADTGDVAVGYRADTKLYIDSKLASAVAELQALILENS